MYMEQGSAGVAAGEKHVCGSPRSMTTSYCLRMGCLSHTSQSCSVELPSSTHMATALGSRRRSAGFDFFHDPPGGLRAANHWLRRASCCELAQQPAYTAGWRSTGWGPGCTVRTTQCEAAYRNLYFKLLQIHLQSSNISLNHVLLTSLLHLLSHMPHAKDPAAMPHVLGARQYHHTMSHHACSMSSLQLPEVDATTPNS